MGKTKLSDCFNSMDEVSAYVKSLKLSPENEELLRFLFGLIENEGDCIPVKIAGKKVNIDISIVETVKAFNNAGFKVLACCSGLAAEHSRAKFFRSSGYISILKTASSERLFRKIFTYDSMEINYDEETYLQPSISIRIEGSERVKAYKWGKIHKDVMKEKQESKL